MKSLRSVVLRGYLTLDSEALVEGIIQIANANRVKEHLEPSLMLHQDIQKWMVVRVLYSYCLLIEESNKGEK